MKFASKAKPTSLFLVPAHDFGKCPNWTSVTLLTPTHLLFPVKYKRSV